MDYLIRFAQAHESFRFAEIESLTRQLKSQYTSRGLNVDVEVLDYQPTSPFCIIRFHIQPRDISSEVTASDTYTHTGDLLNAIAASFIARSIQSRAIYALWGHSNTGDYSHLHDSVRTTSQHLWHRYKHIPFKFTVDTFMGKRSEVEKREIINEFAYMGFEGKVEMKRPVEEWCVMEEWERQRGGLPTFTDPELLENGERVRQEHGAERALKRSEHEEEASESEAKPAKLKRTFLGRKVGTSRRQLIEKHDLKKRPYISTTSMDAELALITANLALASPEKLFLDPFCGTGGFMIAAAELGAFVIGHDIDGRSFRGKDQGLKKGVESNFRRYALQDLFGDCFTADLVNTPLVMTRGRRWLDGIIADPPYGVREGLKVLGSKKPDSVNGEVAAPRQPHLINGVPAHTLPGFIAPKRPYSFVRMLDDILDFASRTLVDGGRVAFWMPSANENEFGEEEETVIPRHYLMDLKHECVQRFNKWSRRLLVYERIPGDAARDALDGMAEKLRDLAVDGTRADDLNPFRRRYFQAFAEKPNG